ncbi:hypothetical protein [Sphingomonas bacterium]|uniref:hypothetical protein n=1 Tax=Sphingomonas bacterium TaxID=1895847 RepID=UPI00261F1781|nr:hypothetical protein [Sphingomonas bacterium]MDB5678730.1 hypothetical protein [Sphingomonas bacterium]
MISPSLKAASGTSRFDDVTQAMAVTWWVCLPIMTVIATAWFGLVDGFNFRPEETIWEMAAMLIIGVVMIMIVGAIVSLTGFLLFGLIAGFAIRWWGGGRAKNMGIGLSVCAVGGAVI